MKVGPLDFLLSEEGHPWMPTLLWAVPKPKSKRSDFTAWDLSLDPPSGASLPLHDLKRWMLFNGAERRFLELPPDPANPKSVNVRLVTPAPAVTAYLKALRDRLPVQRLSNGTSLLIPAIGDQGVRKRYIEAIKAAFPNARILPEPEMVVEYFRLVRRTLTLDAQRNNVILVIDVGASTSNLSIVLSNRRDQVVSGGTERQRIGRLRAIQGECGKAAGHWVDEWLARRKQVKLDELPASARQQQIRRFEEAKIEVSMTGKAVEVVGLDPNSHVRVEPADIEEAALEVVTRLGPVLETMCLRLWKQLTGTPTAKKQSKDVRAERKVKGPKDALKLVDVVLLAGGTSRLRGFREQLLDAEFGDHRPIVHEVGESFPVAAAVGALAHVLHDKYTPPRVQPHSAKDDTSFTVPLEGGLDVDIQFAWKPATGSGEQVQTVLERGDPKIYSGGTISSVAEVDVASGDQIKARLIPGSGSKRLRKGLKPHLMKAKGDRPSVDCTINSDRRIRINSKSLTNTPNVWIDLSRFDRVESEAPKLAAMEVPEGTIAFEATKELVIDFGMSKTVVVASDSGLLRPEALDAACRGSDRVTDERPSPAAKQAPPEPPRAPQSPPDEEPELQPQTPQTGVPVESERGIAASPVRVSDVPASPLMRSGHGFIEALTKFHEAAQRESIDIPSADVLFTLLGLCTRPVVLLAGPPGSGKSTLARAVGHLLGRKAGETFHEIPVQAHWLNDEALFGSDGLLQPLLRSQGSTHLVMFDEFNLTQPEYYLSRFFHAVECASRGSAGTLDIDTTLAIGTLNIDETSRAPSPKVLDRCFLVEVGQVPYGHHKRRLVRSGFDHLPRLPGLPLCPSAAGSEFDPRLETLLQRLHSVVSDHGLREDLLPSRRVLDDIRSVLQLHEKLGKGGSALLATEQLLDRLIASRVLVKIAGPIEQVEPALACLEKLCEDELEAFERSRRRVALARRQARLGFVSPWQ